MIYIVFYGRNKPAVVNDGAGPDKNMLTPSAILPCKVGRLTNLVPRLWYLCLRDARLLLISARHFTYNKVCGRITPFFQGGQWNNRNITPKKINISINLCLCYKASKAKTMFFSSSFHTKASDKNTGPWVVPLLSIGIRLSSVLHKNKACNATLIHARNPRLMLISICNCGVTESPPSSTVVKSKNTMKYPSSKVSASSR